MKIRRGGGGVVGCLSWGVVLVKSMGGGGGGGVGGEIVPGACPGKRTWGETTMNLYPKGPCGGVPCIWGVKAFGRGHNEGGLGVERDMWGWVGFGWVFGGGEEPRAFP